MASRGSYGCWGCLEVDRGDETKDYWWEIVGCGRWCGFRRYKSERRFAVDGAMKSDGGSESWVFDREGLIFRWRFEVWRPECWVKEEGILTVEVGEVKVPSEDEEEGGGVWV
ncbi:unnamed protein product [Lathyrus oleraceus]